MPRITRTMVTGLKPAATDYHVWDTTLPRFGVKVTPAGGMTYVARYSVPGKPNGKIKIGRVVDMTPEEARERARAAFSQAAAGIDPAVARTKLSESPTMAELRDAYTENHAKVNKAETSQINDELLWRLHVLPAIGEKRRISDVQKVDVASMHAKIKKAGKLHTANRALSLLSKAFNLAIEWGWLPQNTNPCDGLKKYREERRERPVRPEELKALGAALVRLGDQRRDLWRGVALIWLWLLTGTRMREIMHSRWSWVDWERRLLIRKTKTGQKLINLPEPVIELLRTLPSYGKSEWLIPGDVDGQPMVSPRRTVELVLETAGIDGLRIHDMRHVFGSVAGMSGTDLRTIADMLGHSQLSTTERYIQGVGSSAQRAADATATAISGMMGK